MKKRKTRTKKKNNSFRKLVAVFAISLSFAATTKVFFTATLSKINYEVEVSTKDAIIKTKFDRLSILPSTINDLLNPSEKVQLASLNKIDEVAQQQGLSYNNNNIRSVGE